MNQIKLGALISYIVVGFNAVAGLLYTPWMISCIGADDYALYTLVISVVNFFLMDFGLSNAAARFLSKYYAEGKKTEARALLGILYKLYIAISALIFIALLVVYLLIDSIYSNLGAAQLETFKGLFLIVAVYSVISFPCLTFSGVLTANERFIGLNVCNLLQKVSAVLLIIIALLAGLGVYSLVLANAATSLFFALMKYILIRRNTEAKADMNYWNRGLLLEVAGFSGWVTLTNVCARFIFAFMPSVLAMVSSSWEIALFGLAASLEGYVYTVASALGNLFMPKVSRILFSDKEDEDLQQLMIRVGRIQLYIIGFIVIAFAALGREFVVCWMGPNYFQLYLCALLLIVPSLFELPQMVGTTAVEASANVKWRALVYLVISIINVLLSILFGSLFGAIGACFSIFIAYCTRAVLMNIVYKRVLGIRVSYFFINTYKTWIIPAVIVFIVGQVAVFIIPGTNWLSFFAQGLLLSVSYIVLMWLMFFNKYEKTLSKGLFTHRK